VVVVFALLWLPIHLFLLLVSIYGPPAQATNLFDAVYVFCTGLAYFNSCVNPIIYNRTSKDFRDAFRLAVGCQKRVKVDIEDDVVVTPLQAAQTPAVSPPAAAAAAGQRPDEGPHPGADEGAIHVEM